VQLLVQAVQNLLPPQLPIKEKKKIKKKRKIRYLPKKEKKTRKKRSKKMEILLLKIHYF